MDFSYNEDHQLIRKAVREWAEGYAKPLIIKQDIEQRSNRDLLLEMGKQGFLGVCIPEKYGGANLDYISLGIVSEELERVDTSLRVVISVHVGLNSLSLLQWGTEEQKLKYLTPQAEGKKLATFALTEPDAGSDPANLRSTAKKDGDYYILNGEKMWVSLAHVADNYVVYVKTDTSKGARGISAFIVESNLDGITHGSIKNKLGVRAGDTGWISMQDVAVHKDNMLGFENEGFKIAMSALDNGRFTVASGSIGLGKACLEASLSYAKERQAFGKSISDFQLVRQKIANMIREIECSELLVLRSGHLKNKGIRNTRETALAKWNATNMAWNAADDAVQIHGAYGFSAEYPVERYLRNSRGARIYEGTDEIQALIQARYALGEFEDKPLRCELPAFSPSQ